MFESDFFEFFSRIPPWQPPVIFGPVILWALYQGFVARSSIWAFGLLVLFGVINWTLMEYWTHRLLFHYEPKSKLGKRFIWLSHGVHHDWPHDKLRLVFAPAISIPLAVLVWFAYGAIFDAGAHYAAFGGTVLGYLAYDMLHYYTHHFVPKSRPLKFLRAYHLAHHFKNEPTRYGVSTPLWDYVFGTRP